MLKKTITYTDFNGTERTESFYFNLNQAELAEMELSMDGGLSETMARLVEVQAVPELAKIFKELITKSYGEKSADGKRFIKSEQMSEEFTQTNAYAKLYVELISDAKAAAAFFNEVIPADLAKQNKDVPPAISVRN